MGLSQSEILAIFSGVGSVAVFLLFEDKNKVIVPIKIITTTNMNIYFLYPENTTDKVI